MEREKRPDQPRVPMPKEACEQEEKGSKIVDVSEMKSSMLLIISRSRLT